MNLNPGQEKYKEVKEIIIPEDNIQKLNAGKVFFQENEELV
jgi:hypothetical protein